MILKKQELDDLTIIIPTYERQNYLLRQILYLVKWNVEVIIVDGSSRQINKRTQQIINQNNKIKYYYLKKSYTERVHQASKEIKTDFVMCLAEDDFYLKSGIEKSLKKLRETNDAVACMGRSIGIDCFKNKYYVFKYGENLTDYNIDQEKPKSRLEFGFNQYRSATPYAVYRTGAFQKVWKLRENVSCLEVVEYENTINTLLLGKVVTSNSLYWIRSFETLPIASKLDGVRKTDFNVWYNAKRFETEKEKFKIRILNSFETYINDYKIDNEIFYIEIMNKIISRSHSSLVEKNSKILLYEKFVSNLKSIIPLNLLTESLIWEKYIKPLITIWHREKIKYSHSDYKLNKTEIKETIEFANNNRSIVY